MLLDAALLYIRSLKEGETFLYIKVTKKFNIPYTTLLTYY